MKKLIFILTILLLNNISKAQMIKAFYFIKVKEDSISTTWSAKVKFDSTGDAEKRLNLVKVELEKNYQIKSDRIISIESFIGKKYLTYLYTVKVKKDIQQKQNETEQVQIQHPNTNGDEMLSTQEAELLNSLLENSRGTFDFHGKKIVFITGSSGSKVLSKTDFFDSCINPWTEKGRKPQIFIVELTGEDKNKSGGYDAFVLSWVKVFTDKRKKKVIEQLTKSE